MILSLETDVNTQCKQGLCAHRRGPLGPCAERKAACLPPCTPVSTLQLPCQPDHLDLPEAQLRAEDRQNVRVFICDLQGFCSSMCIKKRGPGH
ncbi:hypothetical protein SRHO_G00322370 [Serrasalmus rhombeus]